MATMAATMAKGQGMVSPGARTATGAPAGVARDLLLFFAAPLIGLAYIVVFPFVGCVALARAALLRRSA